MNAGETATGSASVMAIVSGALAFAAAAITGLLGANIWWMAAVCILAGCGAFFALLAFSCRTSSRRGSRP